MICATSKQLTAALRRYRQFRMTRSVGLQELRDRYIPVTLRRGQRSLVIGLATAILNGGIYKRHLAHQPENVRMAVSFLVMEAWRDTMLEVGTAFPNASIVRFNVRVAVYAESIPRTWAFLAIRNSWGGKENPEVDRSRLTRFIAGNRVWMAVYMDIYKWHLRVKEAA